MTTGERKALQVPVNLASGRIEHIDALRAGAVLLVVLLHSGLTAVPGDGGVTVFFVISGFIITSLLLREQSRTGGFDVRSFYKRRLLKLAPPFLVVIVVPTLFYVPVRDASLGAFASQVLFSYNWFQVAAPASSAHVLPGTDVVWSLAVEEQFYIAFSLLWVLALARRWREPILLCLSLGICFASLAIRVALVEGGASYLHVVHGTDARLEAIALGVAIALALSMYRDGRLSWLARLRGDWVILTAAALIILGSLILRGGNLVELGLRPTFHAWAAGLLIVYPMFTTQTVLARAFLGVATLPMVQLIGLSSYSIYLVHSVMIHALAPTLAPLPTPAVIAANVVLSLVPGIILYKVVEVPVLRYKTHSTPIRT